MQHGKFDKYASRFAIDYSGISTRVTENACNNLYASQYVLFVKSRVLVKIKRIA